MSITNVMLIFVVLVAVVALIAHSIKKNKDEIVEQAVEVDDKTYTLDKKVKFVKKRLDEIEIPPKVFDL